MAPQKDAKNLDALGDDSNPNAYVLLERTPRVVDAIKTWTQVFDVLEYVIINYPNESVEEDEYSFKAKLRDVAHSKLHKIAA